MDSLALHNIYSFLMPTFQLLDFLTNLAIALSECSKSSNHHVRIEGTG